MLWINEGFVLDDAGNMLATSLCELEDAVTCEPVVSGPRGGFLEDAEQLETATTGEGGELGNLPLAGLIGGGDPDVDGGALSQLNPLGAAVGNRLILLVQYLSRTG